MFFAVMMIYLSRFTLLSLCLTLFIGAKAPVSPSFTQSTSSDMSNNTIRIEIWSDMVCPFCYLGKKKLEKAIEKLNLQAQTEIIWHSYQLDPDFPEGKSVSATQHLKQQKGFSESQLKETYKYLQQSGAPYGIDFQFEKCLSFNTLDAHRLWHWSKSAGKEHAWKEAVMQAYFSKGMDLSKSENLLNLAESCGLDRKEAKGILESDRFAKAVHDDQQMADNIGIRGVPFFIINGKQGISGAQDDSVFETALRKAANP